MAKKKPKLSEEQKQSLHRWAVLAMHPKDHVKAAQAYMEEYPGADVVEASRKVKTQYQKYLQALRR